MLEEKGVKARVVSMPCFEEFEKQSADYKESVLPAGVKARVCVEAGSPYSWYKYAGATGEIIAMDGFGASAPAKALFDHFGFTAENVVEKITDNKYSFSNKLVPLLLSISGYDKYTINGVNLHGFVKAARVIKQLLGSKQLFDTSYYHIDFKSIENTSIENNLLLINKNFNIFMPTELLLGSQNDIGGICININNLISTDIFHDLNDKYFPNNNLDLRKIFIGEEV